MANPGGRGASPRRSRLALGLAATAFAVALVASACAGPEPSLVGPRSPSTRGAAFPATLTDDEGVEVTVRSAPQRIVTWAPSITEILFALGLGDRVIGVSGGFDDFPPEAQGIEQVGGSDFEPNVERVVSLEADLVLAGFGGGEEWKGRLRAQGIAVFTVLATDYDDAVADIETIGRLTGSTVQAGEVARTMRAKDRSVRESVSGEPRVTCFYEVGFEGGFFTVGPGSFIYDLLERAGCDPATSDATEPFPQWSVEEVVRDDPDVYLVSSDSVGSAVESVAARPGFGGLTAVKEGRVVLIDADLLDRPGPRLADGFERLARVLHPEAF
jgi:iron complex transport system substrate-binding protein